MLTMRKINTLLLLGAIVFMYACGGSSNSYDSYNSSSNQSKKRFVKNPVDDIIRDNTMEKSFSIILYDMNVEDMDGDNRYYHKYAIVKEQDTVPTIDSTDWKEVDEQYFWENEDNMGMEIASKTEDGKVKKVASPPGYSNYVGNPRYGHWQTNSSGQSFWAWYGRYAFMSSMFRMAFYPPIYYSHYSTYRSYYVRGQSYYGGTGSSPTYGSRSSAVRKSNPNFFQRKANSTAWTKSSSRRNTNYRGSSYGKSSSKTSSSTSRSGGSYRSSGSSYGK